MAEPTVGTAQARVVAVDLDGTLHRGDVFIEGLLTLLVRPSSWPGLIATLKRGRARMKEHVSERVPFDPTELAYREELISWLQERQRHGDRLVLATGADRRIAESVARHLALFDDVLASEDGLNLTGSAKLTALVKAYGHAGFEWVGDGRSDRGVAESASVVHPVGTAPDLRKFLQAQPAKLGQWFEPREGSLFVSILQSMRPSHWLKNALVALPIVASHELLDPNILLATGGVFLAFCAAASSVYLINDIVDLPTDRRHPEKRLRPIASGLLQVPAAVAVSASLAAGSLILAHQVAGEPLLVCLVLYLGLTLAYSLQLKRVAPIDTSVLAVLYILRVIAGTVASGLAISYFLLGLAFSVFWSMSLAKRTTDLRRHELDEADGLGSRARSTSWRQTDAPIAAAFGAALAAAGLVVLSIYAASEDVRVLYSQPVFVWATIPLLGAWLSRLWLLAWRGEIHSDPITWAIRDRTTVLLSFAAFVLAALGAGDPGGMT